MKRIKSLLLFTSLFCVAYVNAQTFNLRIDSVLISNFSTVHYKDSFAVSIIIHNDSAAGFNGQVYIGSVVNGDTTNHVDSIPGDAFFYPTFALNESITGGNFVTRSLVINAKNPPFIIGSSGVVIWPIMKQNGVLISSVDSLAFNIQVLHPLGINQPDDKSLRVFVFNRQLIVQSDGEHPLKTISLYDVDGKLLHQQAITASEIFSLDGYSNGIYLAEITFSDNTHQVFKVFSGR
jgi:hypothetical protein